MLQRAQQVHSCDMACTARQCCVTVCLVSAVSCYGVLGECSLVLLCARQVMSHVTMCSASDVSRYSMLGK